MPPVEATKWWKVSWCFSQIVDICIAWLIHVKEDLSGVLSSGRGTAKVGDADIDDVIASLAQSARLHYFIKGRIRGRGRGGTCGQYPSELLCQPSIAGFPSDLIGSTIIWRLSQ
jgi:hypothetical protein